MSDLETAIADAVKTGWIRLETIDGEDYVVLTETGAEWLRQDQAARERSERIKKAQAAKAKAA